MREQDAVGRLVICAIMVMAINLMGSRSHAATPEALCAQAAAVGVSTDAAASAALTQAAATIEARLSRAEEADGGAEDSSAALDVSLPASSAPTAAALAAYCSAVGEVERVGRSGSPPRARAFLLSAFTYADRAHDAGDAARAAYRLGLLASTDSGPAHARGAGPTGPGKPAPDDADASGNLTGDDACSLLQTQGWSPSLALLCAATRAGAAGDSRLVSLANLRLARLRLAAAANVARRDTFAREFRRPGGRGESPDGTNAGLAPEMSLAPPILRDLAADAAISGLAWARNLPDPATRVQITGRLVEAAIDAGTSDTPALARATRDMEAALPGDPAGRAYAAALSGRVALASGDRAAARALFERAIFYESQAPRPTRLADWYLLMARASPDQRAKYAHDAYLALENVRAFLPLRDVFTEESTFDLHMRTVFEAAADAALSAGAGVEPPDAITSAQQIVEASREAEIQSNFGSECIPSTPPIKPDALRKDEIVLYPVLLEDRVELLYAVGGDAAFHRLAPDASLNRDLVAALVDQVRQARTAGREAFWQPASRRLYRLLIAPIENRLSPDTTLVIMPDGPLRALPFAALLDGHDKFLIERTRLSLAPALTYAQPGLDRAGGGATVVAAALEREVILRVGTFPKLDETGNEARAAVGGAAGGRRSLLLENFTRASLTNALEFNRPSVLHLATHAAFNGRSDRSYIVADGEAIPMADLRAMIAQSRARGDALDLLVLSACETAVGDDQASMGLASSAVQAGARSAIASIWEADDQSTTALMKAFYAAYRGGATKAEALRTAQLAVLSGGSRDPYFWAAFTLIGGWR